eukprot:3266049-Amphidinium_carterae.1
MPQWHGASVVDDVQEHWSTGFSLRPAIEAWPLQCLHDNMKNFMLGEGGRLTTDSLLVNSEAKTRATA